MLETQAKTEGNHRTLVTAALVVMLLMAAAGAWVYLHENHGPVEVTAGRLLTIPVHTKYSTSGRVYGAPEEDDVTYVVAEVRLTDRADVPVFLKDIHGSFTTVDGGNVAAKRIASADLDRLFTLLPALKPQIEATGLEPIEAEQTVPVHGTANGYVLLLFAAPPDAWARRASAQVQLDFYHQGSVTLTLPK